MPIWINTTIEITGKREVLDKIYSAIIECLDMPEILADGSTNSWVGHIFDKLSINTKKYAPDRTFWDEPRFNKKGHLLITEMSAWEKSKCADALKLKFYEISGKNYITI